MLEDLAAVLGEFVEAFLAVVFLAPFAVEETLGFEAAKKRVKGAFVDLDAEAGEILAQGVAVMLAPELGEDRDDEETAAELEAEIIEKIRVGSGSHLRGVKHYVEHSMCGTVKRVNELFSEYFWAREREW